MDRVFNFAAGPACLPEDVLKKAQAEFITFGKSGMNVMEMSHRSKDYMEIISQAEADLRSLLGIPENYKVLFLQGGASTQFAMIPMNLANKGKAHFVNTGAWAKKAISEAKKYLTVNIAASSDDKNFTYIPSLDSSMFTPDADYVHITSNETISGARYRTIPETNGLPLVSDMSSCILSEVIDVSKYALIYAGAQKNIGPAGVTIVIIREDLIRDDLPAFVPTMMKYKTHSEEDSLYNTPPTYAIYMSGLVFKWLLDLGGVPAMQKINEEKAGKLYDFLDNSKMLHATVQKEFRSIMNVPFVTGSDELDDAFVKGAKAEGLVNLKGHRSVGGMRASIYNAMPREGVDALINYMKSFELQHK
ncbi:MAG: 3-phosphoserine/phosphohydroxythreonine transaminase [Eubacteriales bacterium]